MCYERPKDKRRDDEQAKIDDVPQRPSPPPQQEPVDKKRETGDRRVEPVGA